VSLRKSNFGKVLSKLNEGRAMQESPLMKSAPITGAWRGFNLCGPRFRSGSDLDTLLKEISMTCSLSLRDLFQEKIGICSKDKKQLGWVLFPKDRVLEGDSCPGSSLIHCRNIWRPDPHLQDTFLRDSLC